MQYTNSQNITSHPEIYTLSHRRDMYKHVSKYTQNNTTQQAYCLWERERDWKNVVEREIAEYIFQQQRHDVTFQQQQREYLQK